MASAAPHGSLVQVDPIKPMLKAPGMNRLNLNYNELLSDTGFNFDLRRYIMALSYLHAHQAGAYTRSPLSST